MKKSLFYILLTMGVLMAMPSHAIKYPSYQPMYRSTSYMVQSSHTYERQGVSVAVTTPMSGHGMTVYTPFSNETPQHDWNVSVSGGVSGPRRVHGSGDEEDEDGENENLNPDEIDTGEENPNQPIGALPTLLMLMLCVGYAYRIRSRRLILATK